MPRNAQIPEDHPEARAEKRVSRGASGAEWYLEDYDPLDEAPSGDPKTDCTGEPDATP
jgi:hypothetical protein